MAVTRTGQVVHMTTAATDELTGTVILRGVVCDAATTLTDSAGGVIFKSGGATTITFNKGIQVDGIAFAVGTTVTLYI